MNFRLAGNKRRSSKDPHLKRDGKNESIMFMIFPTPHRHQPTAAAAAAASVVDIRQTPVVHISYILSD